MRLTGRAVFFTPTGELLQEMSEVIRILSKELQAPLFTPHVSITTKRLDDPAESLGALNARMTEFARALAPYRLTFDDTRIGNDYFRSVFVAVIPSTEVLRANAAAVKILQGGEQRKPYEPHLSLLYGEFSEGQRRAVAERFKTRFQGRTILVEALELWDLEGTADEWRCLARFPLCQPQKIVGEQDN